MIMHLLNYLMADHYIAEILLKLTLDTNQSINKSNGRFYF